MRRRTAVDRGLDIELFKAMGDRTRLALLACLIKCGRACSVTEVAACCAVDFSVVSRHLGILSRAGVLEARKQGRTMWYQARGTDLAARLRELADAIDECVAGCDASRCAENCCPPASTCEVPREPRERQ